MDIQLRIPFPEFLGISPYQLSIPFPLHIHSSKVLSLEAVQAIEQIHLLSLLELKRRRLLILSIVG